MTRVLEIAAGTGVVTRALAAALPAQASIVATDLNQAMLDQAAAVTTGRPLEWRQADALQLPFENETFDAIVCQFGAMFFPDKPKAFSEARDASKLAEATDRATDAVARRSGRGAVDAKMQAAVVTCTAR